MFSLQYLPTPWRLAIVPNGQSSLVLVPIIAIALTLAEGSLLRVAIGRFRRPNLLAR
jgi:hypothetical protein